MSFLQQGKWNRPALALGFDPVAVVQRAFVTGALVAPGQLQGPTPAEVKKARALYAMRRLRAVLKAAGLNVHTGLPLKNRKHPELRGLTRKEYHRRYVRQQRASAPSPISHLPSPK